MDRFSGATSSADASKTDGMRHDSVTVEVADREVHIERQAV